MIEDLDRRFMAAAIRLGASANGSTWPNPAVGAILVKDGAVIARGRTARGGRPHAEAAALAVAGERARGATMVVSLEPCAHQGRAGPCADAIVTAGVGRVVAAVGDPDPRVHGAGFQRLRAAAGVEVQSGILAEEARQALAGHFRRVESGRPHVVLKLAVSADDAIGRVGEAQVAVTGDVARRHAQALRSRFDAILVGRGTVEADDPELTVRLPGLEHRSPIRVVLDSEARLAGAWRILGGSIPTWVLGSRRNADSGNVRSFVAPRSEGGLDLGACLRLLTGQGITRLLVEGGAMVARGLAHADLVDEVVLFRSQRMLGGTLVPALADLPLSTIERSEKFDRIERRRFGSDMMSRYVRVR